MVGVGGRSKGCITCRRRKLKCDEGKPDCERCTKGGFQCEGYIKYAEFVNVTNRFAQRRPAKWKSSSQPRVPSCSSSKEQSHALLLADILPWDEQHIFTSYLVDRLFTWHEDEASPYAASWISVLYRSEDPAGLSMTSLRALATTYFGKVHGQTDLMRRGAVFYSQALQCLRVQLQSPDQALEPDLLVAILCLGIHELVTLTQSSAWLQHYKGLARITELRGPHRHQTGLGYALLPTLRTCIAVGCLVERKRCFLEDPSWKTTPWAGRMESKTPTDDLHDVLCDIPGLLEDFDKQTIWDPNIPGRALFQAQLCQRLLSILKELHCWRWKWQDDFPNTAFSAPLNEPLSPNPTKLPRSPFKNIIWFTDPCRATELITYDALLLILLRTAELLRMHIPNLVSTDLSDPLLPMQGTIEDIAIEICRMVEYHLQDLQRSSGAFMLLFPLNIAYRNLPARSTEANWLEEIMAVVANIHGFEISRRENMPGSGKPTNFEAGGVEGMEVA
ncbi:Zn(II)2Cys6 transcription factor domain-containing protein [Aspergillus alliaceus]|uniref:Zn(II)2Cys6 transcription factor domain-containing protein n=1 Tax=Petromyces alliaceus TaxID=209559 RepID=UPI0012A41447|nr:uncharacterized protein BDW43DRAFT_305331 [Aspergillus alliaceus]KAB8239558.1 hypothetical protein BDW43DRAFT_305331 [Aspergillus alliaceus]